MVAIKKKSFNCFDTTAKILLIVFNCILWAFGIAVLAVGIWVKTNPDFANLGQAIKAGNPEPVVEIVTWLFIGAGIFVFAVGVVGMIGIIRESKIMMGFYLSCIFLVFITEAGAGAYAGVRRAFIIESLKEEGSAFIKTIYTNDPNEAANHSISKGFNYVQVSFQCCGMKDFMDYDGSKYLGQLGDKVRQNVSMSWACCETSTLLDTAFKGDGLLTVDANVREICMEEAWQATRAYTNPLKSSDDGAADAKDFCNRFEEFHCQQGCIDGMVDWTMENMVILIAVGSAFAAVQLILMLLALWFCQTLGREEQ
ncbi:CD82 antigen-like [Watersipora subatra]|uniref:CD82 antigen-like n=1 Tax=Watersipora subatra TaxID=2589382 RepID=UPI00355B02D6